MPRFKVSSVERKPYRRSPYAPFRTTTLQQEGSRKLGFSTKYTMSVAQRLYENGYITYMRTDSIQLSQTAIDAARSQARELYGAEYVPDAPRTYASKVKNAQEAHEAIRPAGDRFRTPAEAQRSGLKGDELRLYDLIWKRTVSCQMKDATGESVSVRVEGTPGEIQNQSLERYRGFSPTGQSFDPAAVRTTEFGASGKVINFYGFLKAYVESNDDQSVDRDDQERRLPPLAESDPLTALRISEADHATRPPARYTEASLIKELEDREIGRPSTYASIIGTILDRGYVFKKGTALVPSFLAFAVVNLLVQHFPELVDYEFTAQMEDALDEIARGEAERVPWLRRFYFGPDDKTGQRQPRGQRQPPRPTAMGRRTAKPPVRSVKRSGLGLKELVSDITEIDARDVSSFPIDGTDIVVRVGRYGPYLERDGQRANVPEDMAPDELTPEKAEELLNTPSGDKALGFDPVTGRELVAKAGRFGPYVTELLPEGVEGQAADGVAAEVDDAGHGDPRRRGPAAQPAAHPRRARRRAGHRAERPVRAVRQARHREQVAGDRRGHVHRHLRAGQGAAGAAQAPRPRAGRRRAAAARARPGPRERPADGGQGRPVRPVRDRR